jgi:hypothetical protein
MMPLSPPQFAGLILIALVAVVVGWVALRKQPRAIKLFALALLAVSLGYLATTNAPTDMVRALFGSQQF